MGTRTIARNTEHGLRSYACRLRGSDHETVINHTSPGRAKGQFVLDLDLDGVKFTDVRIRRLGPPTTTAGIKRVAEYRGVPFAKAGMVVEVGAESGPAKRSTAIRSAKWCTSTTTGTC